MGPIKILDAAPSELQQTLGDIDESLYKVEEAAQTLQGEGFVKSTNILRGTYRT